MNASLVWASVIRGRCCGLSNRARASALDQVRAWHLAQHGAEIRRGGDVAACLAWGKALHAWDAVPMTAGGF